MLYFQTSGQVSWSKVSNSGTNDMKHCCWWLRLPRNNDLLVGIQLVHPFIMVGSAGNYSNWQKLIFVQLLSQLFLTRHTWVNIFHCSHLALIDTWWSCGHETRAAPMTLLTGGWPRLARRQALVRRPGDEGAGSSTDTFLIWHLESERWPPV